MEFRSMAEHLERRAQGESSHLNDPEHWRDRSKEARAMAEGMANSVFKQKMLDVAANYEHVAQRAEDRRTGKAPKP